MLASSSPSDMRQGMRDTTRLARPEVPTRFGLPGSCSSSPFFKFPHCQVTTECIRLLPISLIAQHTASSGSYSTVLYSLEGPLVYSLKLLYIQLFLKRIGVV